MLCRREELCYADFRANLDEETAANFLLCMVQGLRVMGKICNPQELTAIVDMTRRALE